MRKSDFSDIIFPETQNLSAWDKIWLINKGFRTVKLANRNYIIIPKDYDYVDVTAPVYEFIDNGYVKVCDEYTEKWSNPGLAELAENALKEVLTKTEEQIFKEMFYNNSIDGKSAVFTIWYGHGNPKNTDIPKGFVSDEFIKVFESWDIGKVCFMKKIDAKGEHLSLMVKDEGDIKHIIGVGGKNINRVAKIINASRLHVGCSPTQGANW